MWQHVKNNIVDYSAIKYLIVGLFNTIIGLGVIYLATWLLYLDEITANALGYSVGLLVSFMLNKSWTFRYSGKFGSAVWRFIIIIFIAYAANLCTVIIAIDGYNVNRYLGQALGIIPYTMIGYIGSKLYVFNS